MCGLFPSGIFLDYVKCWGYNKTKYPYSMRSPNQPNLNPSSTTALTLSRLPYKLCPDQTQRAATHNRTAAGEVRPMNVSTNAFV